jgi:hypothetical protein
MNSDGIQQVYGQYPFQFVCTNDAVNHPGKQCARLRLMDTEIDAWAHDDDLPDFHWHISVDDKVWFDPNWTVDQTIKYLNSTPLAYSYSRILYWFNDFSTPLIDGTKTLAWYGFSSTKNDFSIAPHVLYPDRKNIGDACSIPNNQATYGCRQECARNDVRLQCVNGAWAVLQTLTGNDICITDWAATDKTSIISTRGECRMIYGIPEHYTCQRLSDMFGSYGYYDYSAEPYQYITWEEEDGYPTVDDTTYRQIWTVQRCHTQPTCQGMADVFGTQDNNWNETPDPLKAYWTANCTAANCPTKGTSTGGACLTCGTQGATPFWLTGTVLAGCAAITANRTGYPAYTSTPAQDGWYSANC